MYLPVEPGRSIEGPVNRGCTVYDCTTNLYQPNALLPQGIVTSHRLTYCAERNVSASRLKLPDVSGVQKSGGAWGDCMTVCPLPNFSIEQWRMAVIVTDTRYLWRHNMTPYSRLQTNTLAKFVDTTYISFYTHFPYSLL